MGDVGRRRRSWGVAMLGAGMLLGGGLAAAQGTTYVQLILDASGSMYAKLSDGKTRIFTAKNVLSDFISRLPDDPALNVGLRIYGATTTAASPQSCTDSKLVLPMKGLARKALLDTVTATKPSGATPIAYSLQQAAFDFPQDGSRKLIVLVTDGQESCRGDLTAVMDAFRKRGIEVDLRIIGIDLDANAQRSFQGVGTFENARSSGELASALGRAVGTVAQPSAALAPVVVTLTSGGSPLPSGPQVSFTSALGGSATVLTSSGGQYSGSVLPGTYSATVVSATSGTQNFGGLSVAPGAPNRFSFEVGSVGAVKLSYTPAQPIAGATIKVDYSGAPAGARNWIGVAQKSDPDEAYLDWGYVSGSAGSIQLNVPEDQTVYEVRYHLANPDGSSRVIGRSEPFTPKRIAASLKAAPEVTAGSTFPVTWTGPNNQRDYVTIVPKGAAEGAYLDYKYTQSGNPLTLTAPTADGDYELRYASDNSGKTLASLPIHLKLGSYSLQAPASALGGSDLQVKWTGPNNSGDYVTVVKKGAAVGTYTTYFYTRDGNPGKLKLPTEPGDYELRYSSEAGSPNPTLASVPLTITAPSGNSAYSLQAPATATGGAEINVKWTGPNNSGDYVTIVKAGAPVGTYTEYFYTRDANPGKLKLPFEAGNYELRYSTEGQSPNPTLYSLPIKITLASYSMTAPRQAKAGSTVAIQWSGPNNPGDYITVVKKGAAVGTYTNYVYTRDGNPGKLRMPDEPGEYELRYSTEAASPNPTLYSLPLTVTK
ncbi:VWA domain-containing protein [Deinococcus sp. KNUC1210]|uniref:VWA domain-containing protein n=1 Tax=Deinococcus sp. KNUC1210 TaxID=2917691 RepID=UPI001EEFFD4B|nr:VWA domain-containing protein [Deinococcus sp. KNUC1210]ULH14544.1 VWA domain-containing protein [Deinococcus sp. KNUC1210]